VVSGCGQDVSAVQVLQCFALVPVAERGTAGSLEQRVRRRDRMRLLQCVSRAERMCDPILFRTLNSRYSVPPRELKRIHQRLGNKLAEFDS